MRNDTENVGLKFENFVSSGYEVSRKLVSYFCRYAGEESKKIAPTKTKRTQFRGCTERFPARTSKRNP